MAKSFGGMEKGFEGMDKLVKKFNKIEKQLVSTRSNPLLNSLYDCAKIIKREAKVRCPVGPTGNLKRSIIAKKFRKSKKFYPAAFTALDRKIAPHAHLVVLGTVKSGGNPFLRTAGEASQFMVKTKLENDMKKMIAKAARS